MPTNRELAAFEQFLEIFADECNQPQVLTNNQLREAFDEDRDPRRVAECNDEQAAHEERVMREDWEEDDKLEHLARAAGVDLDYYLYGGIG